MKKLLVAFMVMLALAPVFAGGSSESSGNADAATQIFFFHRTL